LKKFALLAFTAIFCVSIQNSFAQQRLQPAPITQKSERCGTNKWLEDMFRTYPGFKQQFEENERKLAAAINLRVQQIQNNPGSRITSLGTIPIVFHVVLSDQSLVPDAMIMAQLDRINLDYSGLNADSANGSPFYSVRGHSPIQFCLAKRTPTNLPSTGIIRITSATVSNNGANDPIKSTAFGGDDAWDPNKYVNIWVGDFDDPNVLGYGTFPVGTPENSFPLSQQGVVVHYGTLPGGTLTPYNRGRTLTHELGHFLWLKHTWGDDTGDPFTCPPSGGCTGTDFTGTPALDDTPNQCAGTAGCPSGTRFDVCTPGGNGYMYQNYLDYTDDACMTMLTIGQDLRAQTALTTYRPQLLTSNGCVPFTLTPDDASIFTAITPSNGFISCNATVPLTVTLRNAGSNPLVTVRITVKRNGTVVQTFDWTGNLNSLETVAVPLNAVPLNLGANTIEICTSIPNGNPDSDTANDCFSVSGTSGLALPLPLVEGFENATFPPAGWIRNNPDGNITWERTPTGVAHGGIGKAYVDHFNYSAGPDNDDLRTPPFTIGTADSLWVSFWVAYRGYSDAQGVIVDSFYVLASPNCGQTFQVVYSVKNDEAFVAPDGAPSTQSTPYFPGTTNEWVRKSIDLSSFIPSGNVQVQFRAKNNFGNNVFLDDINIDKKIFANNDAGVIAVNRPATRVCSNAEAPVVVIKNFGKINLTSVRINYQIDGTGAVTTFNWTGNLARNQTATVTLATANLGALGNHSINVYTTLPNNVADEDPGNDGLVKPYTVSQILVLPASVTEEFSSPAFPPPNWAVINPNGDITWQRNGIVGNRAPGSAFFNDFVNTTVDRIDDLATPNFSYSGIDSIFLSFNLAHITKTLPGTTGARLDTLTVLVSKDCGNTFTTVYKKFGEELQTVNDPNFQISMNNFVPLASQWRRDSVNLGRFLGATEPLVQVVFRFSGNMENNFYLDDVNFRTQVLPARLKNDGYLILPNPFRTTFGVWHYQVPTTLRYINVYNSVGQLVYSKKYPGGGEKFIRIDLSGRAAGIYTVNIGYEDSNRNLNVQVVKF
jgi:hypothetical protein